jgi:hypothetical protein
MVADKDPFLKEYTVISLQMAVRCRTKNGPKNLCGGTSVLEGVSHQIKLEVI